MKTRNSLTKQLLAMTIALGMLAAIMVVCGAKPAEAIIIKGGKTGLFGIAAGQTGRISVLNAKTGRVSGVQRCWKIFDLSGNVIAEFEGRALGMGEGMFFDFDPSSRIPGEAEQIQVRVEVELAPSPDDSRIQPDDAILTLEVFDNATGQDYLHAVLRL